MGNEVFTFNTWTQRNKSKLEEKGLSKRERMKLDKLGRLDELDRLEALKMEDKTNKGDNNE